MYFRITSLRQLLGYTVASLMVIFGGLIIGGYMVVVFLRTDRLRITFGIVLILFGIFRFVSAYFSEKHDRFIEDDSWKGRGSSNSAN